MKVSVSELRRCDDCQNLIIGKVFRRHEKDYCKKCFSKVLKIEASLSQYNRWDETEYTLDNCLRCPMCHRLYCVNVEDIEITENCELIRCGECKKKSDVYRWFGVDRAVDE